MPVYTYAKHRLRCSACQAVFAAYVWGHESDRWRSDCCQAPAHEAEEAPGRGTAVIGDEVDLVFQHGICHDDGTPRRFRSRTEIRQACLEKGWRNVGAVNGPF